MNIDELDTPAVVIEIDVMRQNLERMASYCQKHQVQLRPHTKTHKIPELAWQQLRSGAAGITVAKIGEAEVMAEAGIKDILLAYPIVSPQKAKRLVRLAERVQLAVSIDSEESACAISKQGKEQGTSVGILVEIDVGFHRCGVANEQAAIALAEKVLSLPALKFLGLMFYPGHLLTTLERRGALIEPINRLLDKTMDAFTQKGIRVSVVSGGSTPSAYLSHEFHSLTEIRPGMYIFNDRNMVGAGVAQLHDCAVQVIVTVVSTAVSGRVITDGGSKTFSSDRFLSGDGQGFGLIIEDADAVFDVMSEEHGHLDITKSSRRYRLGERLTVIPNHVCSTINMHNEIYGVSQGKVVQTWQVAARGKVT